MKTDYKITRDKFMEFKERDWLIKVCKVESENGKLACNQIGSHLD